MTSWTAAQRDTLAENTAEQMRSMIFTMDSLAPQFSAGNAERSERSR